MKEEGRRKKEEGGRNLYLQGKVPGPYDQYNPIGLRVDESLHRKDANNDQECGTLSIRVTGDLATGLPTEGLRKCLQNPPPQL